MKIDPIEQQMAHWFLLIESEYYRVLGHGEEVNLYKVLLVFLLVPVGSCFLQFVSSFLFLLLLPKGYCIGILLSLKLYWLFTKFRLCCEFWNVSVSKRWKSKLYTALYSSSRGRYVASKTSKCVKVKCIKYKQRWGSKYLNFIVTWK